MLMQRSFIIAAAGAVRGVAESASGSRPCTRPCGGSTGARVGQPATAHHHKCDRMPWSVAAHSCPSRRANTSLSASSGGARSLPPPAAASASCCAGFVSMNAVVVLSCCPCRRHLAAGGGVPRSHVWRAHLVAGDALSGARLVRVKPLSANQLCRKEHDSEHTIQSRCFPRLPRSPVPQTAEPRTCKANSGRCRHQEAANGNTRSGSAGCTRRGPER